MGRKKKILIVEDDYLSAAVNSKVLENAGYEVIVAHTCKKALALLHKRGTHLDLVVMESCIYSEEDICSEAAVSLQSTNKPVLFHGSRGPGRGKTYAGGISSINHLERSSDPAGFVASVRSLLEGPRSRTSLPAKNNVKGKSVTVSSKTK
jgi:DNA-binding response OmpR family regulator